MAADITQLRNRQAQFEEQKVKVKGNTRDSVFVSLFSEPEYQLQATKHCILKILQLRLMT